MDFSEILKDIKPDKEEMEKIHNLADKLINIIKKYSSKNVEDVLFVGSSARNTNLKGSYDIDIFILFNKRVSIEKLEEEGLYLGKKAIEELNGKYEINYASHPYIRGYVDKYKVDIVPCYKIEFGERIISAVDRTPLHHKFLIERLTPQLCDEVRLLKAFLKSLGLYGSDVKTKGFSGYLCELLILKYNSFLNLLEDAQNWKKKKVIILDDIYKLYGDIKFKEFDEPLVVYDPVDINRNVAAALSRDNYCKFIFYSREFLKNPKKEFFYNYKEIIEKNLNNREKGKVIKLKIPRDKISDDIVYPQLEKLLKSIVKILEQHEFKLLTYKCYLDENYGFIELEFLVDELPNIMIKLGPPIYNKKRVDSFLKKYDKVFVKDCYLYSFSNRKYTNAIDLLKDIINKKIPISKTKNVYLDEAEIL
ncbi:CCA tRNA nucleotidyltransferase [Methanocaldococcus indicus]|uniref:CCA tRNA nucleotidyltransferase n=1 Tax=Methanocaldococcus indicus TaxID=213231 RepID=UPI003C6CE317